MLWDAELPVATSSVSSMLSQYPATGNFRTAASANEIWETHITTSTGRTRSSHYEYICTIRDGIDVDKECGVVLQCHGANQRNLIAHLRGCHGIQQVKLKTHNPGEPLIQCPDHYCACRFRTKECSRSKSEGLQTSHRSHVVDLLRHCLDRHVRPVHTPDNKQYMCVFCEKTFSRSGSVARHQSRAKSCMKGAA
jgi:hypothetical protein